MDANQSLEMTAIPCSLMRGGSSKGAFFREQDLPADPAVRNAALLAAYGSPDPRQIDGVGGADPLTSKAASVARSARADADLDYTFYQVGIESAMVSMGGTCGNMLAAVVPFALLKGLLPRPPSDGEIETRVRAVNTGQIFRIRVDTKDGLASVEGNCEIAGVPGTGSRIRVDFGDCGGSVSGRLLPTGRALDHVQIGGREVRVSLVDAATPFVFVDAHDIGAKGTESPAELLACDGLMSRLEAARAWAARILGLIDDVEDARQKSPNIPRVVLVSAASEYITVKGELQAAADIDVCVRQLAMQKPHKALAVTGSICTAVAAAVPGTIVHAHTRQLSAEAIRIGHPSGTTKVTCKVSRGAGGEWQVLSAEIERTARLLMDGMVFVRRQAVSGT